MKRTIESVRTEMNWKFGLIILIFSFVLVIGGFGLFNALTHLDNKINKNSGEWECVAWGEGRLTIETLRSQLKEECSDLMKEDMACYLDYAEGYCHKQTKPYNKRCGYSIEKLSLYLYFDNGSGLGRTENWLPCIKQQLVRN